MRSLIADPQHSAVHALGGPAAQSVRAAHVQLVLSKPCVHTPALLKSSESCLVSLQIDCWGSQHLQGSQTISDPQPAIASRSTVPRLHSGARCEASCTTIVCIPGWRKFSQASHALALPRCHMGQEVTWALQQLEKGTPAPVDPLTALKDQTLAVDENFPLGSRSCDVLPGVRAIEIRAHIEPKGIFAFATASVRASGMRAKSSLSA